MQALYARRLLLDDGLIAPYGGGLVQAYVPVEERHKLHMRLPDLQKVDITARELLDLEMIASGAYSPLTGFMTQQQYGSVLESTNLPDGMPWGLPVTLAVSSEIAHTLSAGQEVALYRHEHFAGVMYVTDIFPWEADKEELIYSGGVAHKIPQINERKLRKAKYLLGGAISLLAARTTEWQQKKHIWPRELRSLMLQKDWRNIAAIHLQNPWQRSDEYLLKCALEASDALLLHAQLENSDEKDALLPAVLAGASRLMLENYFPNERLLDNMAPDSLFSKSPRAALQHAILSQNYGCASIFLPAQIEQGATTKELQDVFSHAGQNGLAIRRVFLDHVFYCEKCGGIASEKSCPHEQAGQVNFSVADISKLLLRGKSLPPMVARPDVARAVARGMADKVDPGDVTGKHLYPHVSDISREMLESLAGHKAGVLWMTGLSGSGKSTIAHKVERELILSGHRVYVLDGDTLRTGLNRDLGFGDEARRENLRRAAEVVKVLIDAGLIVIASFISPFSAERQMVREIIGAGFFEVYVEADLETCEERDPKGLYKRARAGVIPKFTGISSPYEAPEQPDLRLNTSKQTLDECVSHISGFLAQSGLLRSKK